MGYACPVCDAEQADAKHLANHLAITASLGREEHREWLAEHAPEWGECTPEELGEIVSQHAPEIETPEFEEGPQGGGHDHGHTPGRPDSLEDGLARQARQPGRGAMTSEAEGVLQEARELTRQMQPDAAGSEGGDDGDAAGDEADTGRDTASDDVADGDGNGTDD